MTKESPFDPKSDPRADANRAKVPTSLLLSLGTIPVLAVLIGSKAILQAMREIGEASEELFRGDRLPILETQNLEKDTSRVHSESSN
ncbi:hypothetical protein [Leptolyngbya ohadii]|uniref:hypothetical protein n=1 Tax=Leptolyngbya ohadii TaxID=1962290 RepID=UPI001CEDAFC7|nr:hypothetical protein [Leptolyngbya ohadii]